MCNQNAGGFLYSAHWCLLHHILQHKQPACVCSNKIVRLRAAKQQKGKKKRVKKNVWGIFGLFDDSYINFLFWCGLCNFGLFIMVIISVEHTAHWHTHYAAYTKYSNINNNLIIFESLHTVHENDGLRIDFLHFWNEYFVCMFCIYKCTSLTIQWWHNEDESIQNWLVVLSAACITNQLKFLYCPYNNYGYCMRCIQ